MLTPRPATAADAAQIARLYNHYVDTSTITFEEEPVDAAEMARRIAEVSARFPWLVVEVDGRIAGYAYATPWRARSAYRFSVESTVYVAPDMGRRGIGRTLYEPLIAALRAQGIRTILAGIAQPNEASVALHEHCGFRKVAHLANVGKKFGRWIDVGYWQLDLGESAATVAAAAATAAAASASAAAPASPVSAASPTLPASSAS